MLKAGARNDGRRADCRGRWCSLAGKQGDCRAPYLWLRLVRYVEKRGLAMTERERPLTLPTSYASSRNDESDRHREDEAIPKGHFVSLLAYKHKLCSLGKDHNNQQFRFFALLRMTRLRHRAAPQSPSWHRGRLLQSLPLLLDPIIVNSSTRGINESQSVAARPFASMLLHSTGPLYGKGSWQSAFLLEYQRKRW